MNLFHGRAHEGLVHLEGMQIDSPNTRRRRTPRPLPTCARTTWMWSAMPRRGLDAEGRPRGIVAQLSRAIVVGPIARLELIPTDDHKPADNASPDSLIEAQIPAQQFKEMGFKEGETLVVTPRRARVFWITPLESAARVFPMGRRPFAGRPLLAVRALLTVSESNALAATVG